MSQSLLFLSLKPYLLPNSQSCHLPFLIQGGSSTSHHPLACLPHCPVEPDSCLGPTQVEFPNSWFSARASMILKNISQLFHARVQILLWPFRMLSVIFKVSLVTELIFCYSAPLWAAGALPLGCSP